MTQIPNRNLPIRVIRVIRGLLFLLLLPRDSPALTPPESFTPGPDVIMGDLPTLIQAGSNGTQVGLMMATDICNNGDVQVDWFRLPETDHPVIPQNLYRMSGGANNNERFEQIGQSWAMHQFFPLQQNACGFGCTPSPDNAHLGVGCSTSDTASFNASQSDLGSRAWVNPFTGIFPSTSNSHTGHTHDGTTHRILVEANDLNTAMNPGATYYGEAQLVTPHEYAWCAAHTGECNMYNNVSYRQFAVAGTTSFTFSAVGDTVRTIPAIFAWPGATIQVIEPEPGVDGKAFLAYKVTQFGPWDWHYEYAIYNQNLDRGINYFSVPAGCGIGSAGNAAFHAPLNHPGIADDGTVGNAGYGNTPWTISIVDRRAYWYTETFAQNPNANALRWGTLYNFRFDGGPPTNGTGYIAFFKTGAPVAVQVQGPAPECTPTIPPPTPTATVPPPTPTATGTPTPSPTPTPTATPSATPCGSTTTFANTGPINILVAGPALPYPSNITVAGLTNPVTKVTVTVAGLSHTFPSDVDMLLVGPTGQKFILVSDVIGGTDAANINWTFDDAAAAFIGSTGTPVNGTFKPTNYTACQDPFAAPAPAGPYLSPGGIGAPCGTGTLAAFNGLNPNGTWSLYVVDDVGGDTGVILNGWSLNITTSAAGCPSPSPTASPAPTDLPPTPTATATATASPTPTPTPPCATILVENFDGVTAPALPPGWSSTFWVTETTDPDTAPNDAYVNAPAFRSDRVLDSPAFIPNIPLARVDFRNNYNLDSGGGQFFDGGVLEISSPNINGGAFTDITDPTVGGSFIAGGYNGQISSNFGNPLAGRMAWSANSGGYIDTAFYFGANVTGQIVRLRFRMGSDLGGDANGGWRIDTFSFTGVCQVHQPTPTPSPTATPTPSPTPSSTPVPTPTPSPPTKAINLSTRMRVQTGDSVGIGGFIITGDTTKKVAVRGIGPSLTQFGIPSPLADPTLELRDSRGALLVANDNWQDDPSQANQLSALGLAPSNPNESGIVATLQPSASYTAILAGKNGGTGVGLVEVYDVNAATGSQLANISTRGLVQTGSNVMIGGFILNGTGNSRIAVRGLGPSLGLNPPLADPTLELHDGNGATLVANDNWQDDTTSAAQLTSYGLALPNSNESGIFTSLPSGQYTVILAGKNGGTGIGLVEVYNIN